jgi:hypothetical protein
MWKLERFPPSAGRRAAASILAAGNQEVDMPAERLEIRIPALKLLIAMLVIIIPICS